MALLLQMVLRMRPSARFLHVHGLFLLVMVPLGFQWVPHGPVVRTLSGILYGFGVVAFLGLVPLARYCEVSEQTPRKLSLYALGLVAALVAVPALAVWGGGGAGGLLAVMALVGLAGIAVLALANVGAGLAWLVSRLRPSRFRPAP